MRTWLIIGGTTFLLGLNSPILASQPTSAKATKTTIPAGFLTCPALNKITKDPSTSIWSDKSGWKSYSPSFAEHLTKFLGAQWQGVNVGTLSCLYSGDNNMTFPVILTYNQLTLAPVNGKWGKDVGGYANCFSSNQNDCLFKPRLHPTPENIYDTVSKLKNHSSQQMAF